MSSIRDGIVMVSRQVAVQWRVEPWNTEVGQSWRCITASSIEARRDGSARVMLVDWEQWVAAGFARLICESGGREMIQSREGIISWATRSSLSITTRRSLVSALTAEIYSQCTQRARNGVRQWLLENSGMGVRGPGAKPVYRDRSGVSARQHGAVKVVMKWRRGQFLMRSALVVLGELVLIRYIGVCSQ